MIRYTSMLRVLLLAAGIATCGTSCQEHKRLEAEAAAAKEKYKEIRPQVQKNVDEITEANNARTAIMNARWTSRSANTPTKEEIEAEVSALQAEKTQLEKEVKDIEETHLQYQKENS